MATAKLMLFESKTLLIGRIFDQSINETKFSSNTVQFNSTFYTVTMFDCAFLFWSI